MRIYLDNAATTPLDPEVFEAMKPFLLENFGNPSSSHSHGRTVRAALESSRKKIAEIVNCTPGEIIFTSGGTEADNAIIHSAVETYGIKNIITSPIEHHAVLHSIANVARHTKAKIHFVKTDEHGRIDMTDLDALVAQHENALVSLMQANNEVGTLLDMNRVADLCQQHKAYFHSDTVQAVGHYKIDLKNTLVHGLTAAAHKFHGPKGVGFMFIRKDKKINPFMHGGPQERSMRGGTENVYGIIGLTKALEITNRDLEKHTAYIKQLKHHMISKLKENIPGVTFNGDSGDVENSLFTVLNTSLPESPVNDMLLFSLDIAGISVSGGSACGSGAVTGSHVLAALQPGSKRGAIRFSFSKFNTIEEIDVTVKKLVELLKPA